MKNTVLDKPIIFIGMPRSGTTIIFERFAGHPDLGWLSNYCEKQPAWPLLNLLCPLLDNPLVGLRGEKKQYGQLRLGNRFYPRPNESYAFWDYYTDIEFSRDYLLDVTASESTVDRLRAATSKVVRYQRKQRFTTKLTGPGRIHYLRSIFPDARFIHVIRDGRSVVHSLLRVKFWSEKGGLDAPFWAPGFPDASLKRWKDSGKDPAVLTGLQWVNVIRTTRQEADALPRAQYCEVRYEDFLRDPSKVMAKIDNFCDLDSARRAADSEGNSPLVAQMNEKYQQQMSPDAIRKMYDVMGDLLTELGYS